MFKKTPVRRKKTCPCGRKLQLLEDVSIACACGRRWTLRVERRTHVRGAALTAGILRELRRALDAMPGSCRRCKGTGFRRPAAVERAALLAQARRELYEPVRDCPRCGGTGMLQT